MRKRGSSIDEESLRRIRDSCRLISTSASTVVFTGAGVSSESGIPVFRGSAGLWERYNPALFGNLLGLAIVFAFSPGKISYFAMEAISTFLSAKPNPAHEAIARLEQAGIVKGVITQNVDNLHRKAGSSNVFEVHGNIFRARCLKCGVRSDIPKEQILEKISSGEKGSSKRRDLLRMMDRFSGRCSCGGRRRPDIVLFGEMLPRETLTGALELASRCDCIIAAGTSALVYPAASIPEYAVQNGAALIEINPNRTRLTPLSQIWISLRASTALELISKEFLSKDELDAWRI